MYYFIHILSWSFENKSSQRESWPLIPKNATYDTGVTFIKNTILYKNQLKLICILKEQCLQIGSSCFERPKSSSSSSAYGRPLVVIILSQGAPLSPSPCFAHPNLATGRPPIRLPKRGPPLEKTSTPAVVCSPKNMTSHFILLTL